MPLKPAAFGFGSSAMRWTLGRWEERVVDARSELRTWGYIHSSLRSVSNEPGGLDREAAAWLKEHPVFFTDPRDHRTPK